MADHFIPVIGLEIHAQIATKSKMFCSCDNDSFNQEPNSNVCPICMGYPGVLPVANKNAIEKGIAAALALNLKINNFCRFDRKNYFYPDLPKGYQISQYENPLSENGYLDIDLPEGTKRVTIQRLHLEDDAGKLTHVSGGTLCDYNRSGTPLMEIVSGPDLGSAEEAVIYAKQIQQILRAISASQCDMEKGMMRFDINVSLMRSTDKVFGTKIEVKNLNSFRALDKAIIYEIQRQSELIRSDQKIVQETRGFDSEKEITVSQRTKEEAHDYRYFPEPDLPPLEFEEAYIEKIRKNLPELPHLKKKRYQEQFKLQDKDITILLQEPLLANFFDALVNLVNDPKSAILWVCNILLKYLNQEKVQISDTKITPEFLAKLIGLIDRGEISLIAAKEEIFPEMWRTGEDPISIIERKGLRQVSDLNALEVICAEVIEQNPKSVTDFKNGKESALSFLIGQAMKLSKGNGNPKLFNEILRRKLI